MHIAHFALTHQNKWELKKYKSKEDTVAIVAINMELPLQEIYEDVSFYNARFISQSVCTSLPTTKSCSPNFSNPQRV